MQIHGLSMILLYVHDLEHSVRWYQQVFGFEVLRQHGDFIVLQLGDLQVGLHQTLEAPVELNNRGCMPVFQVPDYEEAKAELLEKQCAFVYENRTPGSVFGTILDPNGIPLQIHQTL